MVLFLIGFAFVGITMRSGYRLQDGIIGDVVLVLLFITMVGSFGFLINGCLWFYWYRQFKRIFGFPPPAKKDNKGRTFLDPAVTQFLDLQAEKCGKAAIDEALIFKKGQCFNNNFTLGSVASTHRELQQATARMQNEIKWYNQSRILACRFGFICLSPWQKRIMHKTEMELQTARS